MNKPVRVVLIDGAKEEFRKLNEIVGRQIGAGKENTEEMQLLKSIRQKVDFVKLNPFYGDNIPKKQIPKSYHVSNLWRAELVNFWRMMYTIKGDQLEIICFILDIVDHPTYNKIFGYRKN